MHFYLYIHLYSIIFNKHYKVRVNYVSMYKYKHVCSLHKRLYLPTIKLGLIDSGVRFANHSTNGVVLMEGDSYRL